MSMAAAIALAIAMDFLFGDPPGRWHPVAWIGSLLTQGRRYLERGSPRGLLVRGALLVVGSAVLAALAGWAAGALDRHSTSIGVGIEAIALKLSFSLRNLASACWRVAGALRAGDLGEARRLVGFHLVSRPTGELDAGQVASAAVESVAENLTDAFVAPLLCYFAFGLPGAYVYRAINTADAMIGYRAGHLEYFGKVAARLDDVINLIPARVSALAIVVATGAVGGDARCAWRTMIRDHGLTASPNAGWTMSAMAGALGIALEKPGVYRLGEGSLPGAGHIGRSVQTVLAAGLGTAAAMIGAFLLRGSR
jgi:adenosylcobinamide-phosphate synthase